MINEAVLAYTRERALAGPVIRLLAADPERQFADQAAWQQYLDRLGTTVSQATPDPFSIATEGAAQDAVMAHGFPHRAVTISDDAGQLAIARHAPCWIHAEGLVQKLDAVSEHDRASQQYLRNPILRFCADVKAYRAIQTPHWRSVLRARLDRIFHHRTGFVTLDRLLQRLHATDPKCCWYSIVRTFRPIPTVRKTTPVAKGPSAMSTVAPIVRPDATAATPSSPSPKPAASSASPSGPISAPGLTSKPARPSPTSHTSSAAAVIPTPARPKLCPDHACTAQGVGA